MKDRRLQIKKALESMVHRQRAREFQWLAVQLAKTKWPELEATQEQDDGGEDATASCLAADGVRRRLQCSLTGTLRKVRETADRLRSRNVQLDVLVFATPVPVTNLQISEWREKVQREFQHDLHVIPEAEIIALLEQPRNAWMCREYLDVDLPDEGDLATVEVIARQAAARIVDAWKDEYDFQRIDPIELTLVREPDQTSCRVQSDHQPSSTARAQVISLVRERKRVVLAGPAGAGKTFTMIQLAELLLQDQLAPIPILISLSGWASCALSPLAYVQQQLEPQGVSAPAVSRLIGEGRFALLLNGWNEIPEASFTEAANRLRDFALNNPGIALVVSTRWTHVAPPLSQRVVVRVNPLSPEQKLAIIQRAAVADRSRLVRLLESNPALASVTNTPLFMAAVIDMARSDEQIPTTRFGILQRFIERTEASPEHSAALDGPPCAGFHRCYLAQIAGAMTRAGATTLSSGPLLAAVADATRELQNEGHLVAPPTSTAVADCLARHHLLVLSPSSGGAYRFVHQQFQEWFASQWLGNHVAQVARHEPPDQVFEFQREVVNHAAWQEPLAFLIEQLAQAGPEQGNLAAKIIRWAMPVDLQLTAELAGAAGTDVWPLVREELSVPLRMWYARDSSHHKHCALAAMLATGAPDFQDILWPLLESDDQQVRLRTYRTWRSFPLGSLGPSWRIRFDKWDDERRAEFVSQMSWYPSQEHVDLVTDLVRNDGSAKVKRACLDLLSEAGAYETLIRTLEDGEYGNDMLEGVLPWLPRRYVGRLAARLKAALANAPWNARRVILEALRAGGDPDWVALTKAEVERLWTLPRIGIELIEAQGVIGHEAQRPNAVSYIASYLEALNDEVPDWTARWLADRLASGQLWWQPFTDYVVGMDDSLLGEIAPAVTDPMLDVNGVRSRAIALGRSGSPVAGRALVREYLEFATRQAGTRDAGLNRGDALKAGIQELPLACLVDAILAEARSTIDFAKLRLLTKLAMRHGTSAVRFRRELSQAQTDSLRDLVFQVDRATPPRFLGAAGLRAELAVVLGAVGRSEDADVLHAWIQEERERLVNERDQWQAALKAWEANGRRGQLPARRGNVLHWNLYQRALVELDCSEAAEVFIRLLRVPDLLEYAAWGLASLCILRGQEPDPPTGQRPRYAEIYERRQGQPASGAMGSETVRYADAIYEAVQVFLPKIDRADFDCQKRALAEAAAALAALRDTRAIPVLLRLALDKYSAWTVVKALHSLVLSGIVVSGAEVAAGLEPFIREHEKGPLGSGDSWFAIVQCLAVILFSDDPRTGVEHIRRLHAGRVRSYHAREILELLGACRAPEATDLLVELSAVPEIRKNCFDELVVALSDNVNPPSRGCLLDLLDQCSRGELLASYGTTASLANAMARVARTDGKFWNEIKIRCRRETSGIERGILARILQEIGTDEAGLLACELVRDDFPVPPHVMLLVENIAYNRIPAAGMSSTYYVKPREVTELRKRLADFVYHDATRRIAASELLAVISVYRLEDGMPTNEPRHPDIELLKQDSTPWPLL